MADNYDLEERIAILTIDGGMDEVKAIEQAKREIEERRANECG